MSYVHIEGVGGLVWSVLPTSIDSVKRLNTFSFYRLATVLRPLATIPNGDGAKVIAYFGLLWPAYAQLNFHLANSEIFPVASQRAARALFESIKEHG